MGVMVKNKVARFFMDHGVYSAVYYCIVLYALLCPVFNTRVTVPGRFSAGLHYTTLHCEFLTWPK